MLSKIENKNQKIEIDLPTGELALLQQFAKTQGKNVTQLICQIIREKIAEDKADPRTFEENGVVYERISIDLPRNIVNFYRYQAHAKGFTDDYTDTFIAFAVCENLKDTINCYLPKDWIEFFNLSSDFTDMAKRENKIKSQLGEATT